MKTGLEDKSRAELACLRELAERVNVQAWAARSWLDTWRTWCDAASGLRALVEHEEVRRRLEAGR